MKLKSSIKYFVLLVISICGLEASEIDWVHDYDKALEMAKNEHKSLYVLITTDTCRWCRKLESETLTDKKIIEKVSQDYVALELTRGKGNYPKALKAPMVPMTYILNSKEEIISKTPGFWDVRDYSSLLDDAAKKLKKY